MPLSGACCKLRRCEPVQARVRSECVVVDPPFFDDPSGLWQADEEMLVETLVTQSAIEALDEAILGRLAGCDVVPFHAPFFLPGQDSACGELGAVVADHHAGCASHLQHLIQFTGHPDAGERGVHDQRHAFPAEVVHHGQHPELAA